MNRIPVAFSVADPVGAERSYVVTPADHGKVLSLGNANDGRVSTFGVCFMPDPSWQGTLGVVARLMGIPAREAHVGFASIPYKRVNLEGLASDRAVVSDPLSGFFIIEVPASALVVGVEVNCIQGFGQLFSWPLSGPST